MASPKANEENEAPGTSKIKVFRPLAEVLSDTTGTMVKVYVGPKRKRWILHEDLLCDRSDYFIAAFQGGFKEATEKEIFMEEEDPEAFALFVDWMYGCTLRWEGQDAETDRARALQPFVKLYCLAEFLGIEMLMNKAMDCYSVGLKSGKKMPSSDQTAYVYEHSPTTSPIRKFIAYSIGYGHAVTNPWKNYYDHLLQHNSEMAFEVIKAMHFYQFCSPAENIPPMCRSLCDYHSHRHTKKCGWD